MHISAIKTKLISWLGVGGAALIMALNFFVVVPLAMADAPTSGGGPSLEQCIDTLCNPITKGTVTNIPEFILFLLNLMLALVGTLSVIFILIGGVKLMASNGNEKGAESGKQTITYAVVGLVASLLAFAIITIVRALIQK